MLRMTLRRAAATAALGLGRLEALAAAAQEAERHALFAAMPPRPGPLDDHVSAQSVAAFAGPMLTFTDAELAAYAAHLGAVATDIAAAEARSARALPVAADAPAKPAAAGKGKGSKKGAAKKDSKKKQKAPPTELPPEALPAPTEAAPALSPRRAALLSLIGLRWQHVKATRARGLEWEVRHLLHGTPHSRAAAAHANGPRTGGLSATSATGQHFGYRQLTAGAADPLHRPPTTFFVHMEHVPPSPETEGRSSPNPREHVVLVHFYSPLKRRLVLSHRMIVPVADEAPAAADTDPQTEAAEPPATKKKKRRPRKSATAVGDDAAEGGGVDMLASLMLSEILSSEAPASERHADWAMAELLVGASDGVTDVILVPMTASWGAAAEAWRVPAEEHLSTVLADAGLRISMDVTVAGLIAALLRSVEMRRVAGVSTDGLHKSVSRFTEAAPQTGKSAGSAPQGWGPLLAAPNAERDVLSLAFATFGGGPGLTTQGGEHAAEASSHGPPSSLPSTAVSSTVEPVPTNGGTVPPPPPSLADAVCVDVRTANWAAAVGGLPSSVTPLEQWFTAHWRLVSVCCAHSGIDGTPHAVLAGLIAPAAEVHVLNMVQHGTRGISIGLYSTRSHRKRIASGPLATAIAMLLSVRTPHYIIVPTERTDRSLLAACRAALAREGRLCSIIHTSVMTPAPEGPGLPPPPPGLRNFKSNFPDVFWAELQDRMGLTHEDLTWYLRGMAGRQMRLYLAKHDDVVAYALKAAAADPGVDDEALPLAAEASLPPPAVDGPVEGGAVPSITASPQAWLGAFSTPERRAAEEAAAAGLRRFVVLDAIVTDLNGHGRAHNPHLPTSRILSAAWSDCDGHTVLPQRAFATRAALEVPDLSQYAVIVAHDAKQLLLHAWEHPALRAFFARGGRVWCTQYAEYLLSGQTVRTGRNSLVEVAMRHAPHDEATASLQASVIGIPPEQLPVSLHSRLLGATLPLVRATFEGQVRHAVQQLQLLSLQGRMDALLAMGEMESGGMALDIPATLDRARVLRNRLVAVDRLLDFAVPKKVPLDLRRVFDWCNPSHLRAYLFGGPIIVGSRSDVQARSVTVPAKDGTDPSSAPSAAPAVAATTTTTGPPLAGADTGDTSAITNTIGQPLAAIGSSGGADDGFVLPASDAIDEVLTHLILRYTPHHIFNTTHVHSYSISRGIPTRQMMAEECLRRYLQRGYNRVRGLAEDHPTDAHAYLKRFRIVSFDLETTGLNSDEDAIIEMAFYDPLIDESFASLVNPEREVPMRTTRIHHISQSMVDSAPPFAALAPRLVQFLGLKFTPDAEGRLSAERLGMDPQKAQRRYAEFGGDDDEVLILMSHSCFSLDAPLLQRYFASIGGLDLRHVIFADSIPLFKMMRAVEGSRNFSSLKLQQLAVTVGVEPSGELHRAETDARLLWNTLVKAFNLTRFGVTPASLIACFIDNVIVRSVIANPHTHLFVNQSNVFRHAHVSLAGVAQRYLSPTAVERMQSHTRVEDSALEQLAAAGCHVASVLLEKRQIEAHVSRFLQFGDDGSVEVVHADGRVRQQILLTATHTTRTTSSSPSCQNIPKGDGGAMARRMLVSRYGPDGRCLEVDYGQLEVAVMAVLAQDPRMVAELNAGVDFHLRRAASFAVSEAEIARGQARPGDGGEGATNAVVVPGGGAAGSTGGVAKSPEAWYAELADGCRRGDERALRLRKLAKVVSFQRMYGGGVHLMHRTTGLPVKMLQAAVAKEEAAYPQLRRFHRLVRNTCLRLNNPGLPTHFVFELPTGMRVSLSPKSVKYTLPPLKNYPIQAFGAELVQIALGQLHRRLLTHPDLAGRAHLCNFVHDSVWVDCHKDCLETAATVVAEVLAAMPQTVAAMIPGLHINVPMPVVASAGHNFGDVIEIARSNEKGEITLHADNLRAVLADKAPAAVPAEGTICTTDIGSIEGDGEATDEGGAMLDLPAAQRRRLERTVAADAEMARQTGMTAGAEAVTPASQFLPDID